MTHLGGQRWISRQNVLPLTCVQSFHQLSRRPHESGEVAISAARAGEPAIEVGRLGAGDFFGEMAALTGESRRATVRATKECALLVLGKAALGQLFETSPELAARVSQVVANRQAGTAAKLSEQATSQAQEVAKQSDHLLRRIRAFFSI